MTTGSESTAYTHETTAITPSAHENAFSRQAGVLEFGGHKFCDIFH